MYNIKTHPNHFTFSSVLDMRACMHACAGCSSLLTLLVDTALFLVFTRLSLI